MNDAPLGLLFGILAALIALSAFFSSSETGMMSLNRYRLKHLAKKKHKGAVRASQLLQRPDRLIGVILIGNNLVNNFAAALTTVLAIRLYGENAIAAASILLTLAVLIFAEVTPKTIAALYPERIAYPASLILKPLLYILHPAVWLVNKISNTLAAMLGVDTTKGTNEHLRPEELRTVVDEHGDLIPDQHQGILLNVLDLEKVTVEDIMIPRNEVFGLDLENDIPTLMKKIRSSEYTRVPVYEGDINQVVGMLHMRNAVRFIHGDDSSVTHEAIKRFSEAPHFVPETTPLHTQLMNFQKDKIRTALVVDEYGDVQGLVTLEDLLEEIVGDFTTNLAEEQSSEITTLDKVWHLVDCSATVRDINRHLSWNLPIDGPKTLNGLIVEHMENIPDGNISIRIDKYQIETVALNNKVIESAKVRTF